MKRPKTGMAKKVREAARKLGEFRTADLANEVSIASYTEMRKIHTAVRDLRRAGEIEAIERGRYRYVGSGDEGRKSPVAKRILRAMHVMGSFSAREIAMLSDADPSYVRTVIRQPEVVCHMELAGEGQTPKGRRELRYRVRHRDKFYLKHVK